MGLMRQTVTLLPLLSQLAPVPVLAATFSSSFSSSSIRSSSSLFGLGTGVASVTLAKEQRSLQPHCQQHRHQSTIMQEAAPSDTLHVFGHKIPDTDAICAALARAWQLNQAGFPSRAYRLGELNKETKYVLSSLGLDVPPLLTEPLTPDTPVAIVDTNNPAELPDGVETSALHSIVDHHKLAGLTTLSPIEVDVRPLCSAGSIVYARMKADCVVPPRHIAGLLLSCILSDSLEFRSPTTTPVDKVFAHELAIIAGIDAHAHAQAMFAHKADISDLSAKEVVLSDSKEYAVGGKRMRVSVHETTNAAAAMERAADFAAAMSDVRDTQAIDDILFFIVDIIREEATFIGVSDEATHLVAKAFNVESSNANAAEKTILLPGVLSRKKQIMPALERAAGM